MSAVQRFSKNEAGRDFVVGDIHGCFDALCSEMERVGFDPSKDRIFSAGDLVDRGQQSADAISWIGQPWFHPVMGNHEQMAMEFAAGIVPEAHYERNGGKWFIDLPRELQMAIAQVFITLPYAIEVETDKGLIGIVHADPVCDDWFALTERLRSGDERAMISALWSRSRIELRDTRAVSGVHEVFVGHTPVDHPTKLGNVWYVDTGCVFGRTLTMLQINGEAA